MADELNGKTIAFLVAQEGIEQVELTDPWKKVEEAGGRAILVAPEAGEVQAYDHLDAADTFPDDGNLVSSRNPDDLPAFTDAMVELFT